MTERTQSHLHAFAVRGTMRKLADTHLLILALRYERSQALRQLCTRQARRRRTS
jgi:hypothetical protein